MPLTPKNRKEEWLEGLVEHETTLTPKNRCEAWMKEIIDASGGGGGGGGAFVVHLDTQTLALDKTWQEIYDAAKVGTVLLINDENTTISHGSFSRINIAEGFYQVWFYLISDNATVKFVAESADDYPLYTE